MKRELATMEDVFCAMAKSKGLLAAFEYYAAPDVAFIDTDPRQFRGLEAVRQRTKTVANSGSEPRAGPTCRCR